MSDWGVFYWDNNRVPRTLLSSTPFSPYIGPGDIVSSALGWWGLRGYNAAYNGKCCDVYSVGDAAHTVLTIAGGDLILANVGGSLPNNSTNICTIKTLYDQSGNAHDVSQATEALRPVLYIGATGSRPAMQFTGGSFQVLSNTVGISAAQPWTFSSVSDQTSGTTSGIVEVHSGTQDEALVWGASTTISLNAGLTGNKTVSAATFHAVQAIGNGASSILYIDGSSSTVNAGTQDLDNVVGPLMRIGYSSLFDYYMTGYITEVGVWGSGFSSGDQSAMNLNQRAYWGF